MWHRFEAVSINTSKHYKIYSDIFFQEAHAFDLQLLRKELDLSFYQQVKLINYIRRQVFSYHPLDILKIQLDYQLIANDDFHLRISLID